MQREPARLFYVLCSPQESWTEASGLGEFLWGHLGSLTWAGTLTGLHRTRVTDSELALEEREAEGG